MFSEKVYSNRRTKLKNQIGSGLILFLGNTEASFNYPANTYHFRQDSDFLYFFGLDHPDFAAVIDEIEYIVYIEGNTILRNKTKKVKPF